MPRKLTHRERFRRLMHYQTVDRGVHHEFGFLDEAIERWHGEGLPAHLNTIPEIEAWFGRDPVRTVPAIVTVHPPFPQEVIEERERTVVMRWRGGAIVEIQKTGQQTIPHYLKYPVESRKDWEALKERLDPAHPDRSQDWESVADEFNSADVPVGVNCGSYIGWIRDWLGFERLAYWCYDERDLLAEMVETLADLYCSVLAPALEVIEVDYANGWEDICYNSGPIVSPTFFKEIVVPPMKRVMRLLRQHGVDVIYTDCDGNIFDLVPHWLDAGLNGMFPCEMNAGSDPLELRRRFGRDVLLFGGVGKKALAGTKQDILAEIRRLAPLVEDGGFIPMVDHRCPEYVSFENYRYYQREKLAMLGFDSEEIEAIEPLRGMPADSPKAKGLLRE